jgi:hypothetical protein
MYSVFHMNMHKWWEQMESNFYPLFSRTFATQ